MLRSLLLPLLCTALLALPATAADAAASRRGPCSTARGRARARRRAGCAPRATRRRATGAFGPLNGIEYEFDGVQLSGTLTASAPADADFRFDAVTTAVVSPKTRTSGGILRRTETEVGGRFLLHGEYVQTAVRPVTWRTTSSARYEENGDVVDCSYPRPFATDQLSLFIYPKRDRIAIRYGLTVPGWACRHQTTQYPSCGNGKTYDADVAFYKEIEFTRRWIRLPVDLEWRLSDTVDCTIRWNGWVKLKKLRDGR